MNNIYFGIVEVDADLYMHVSTSDDGEVNTEFNSEDLNRLDDLESLEIYEVTEGLYQIPDTLTKEDAIESIGSLEGFVHCSEIEKANNI